MNNDTSEIMKLTERISKDPKSKLFVPLAEEYKKAGDIEMAVHVLTEGLKNNPGYVTARSFLGKLLIDQGDLAAAQKEFEEVIKAIPDNLLAQRKLGDLYALQGNPAEALKHYKAVLAINPRDSETAVLVAEAEAGRDIKKLVPGPKIAAAAKPEQAVRQDPAARPAAIEGKRATPSAVIAAPGPTAGTAGVAEEAEEVLFVEPLGPEDAVGEATGTRQAGAGEFDFLAENEAAHQAGDAVHEDAFAPDEAREGASPFPAGQPFAPERGPAAASEQADPFGLAETAAPSGNGADDSSDLIEPFALSEETAPIIDEAGIPPELGEPFTDTDAGPREETPSLQGEDAFASVGLSAAFGESPLSLELDGTFSSEPAAPSEEAPIESFVVDEPFDAVEQTAQDPGEADLIMGELVADESRPLPAEEHEEEEVSDVITAEIVEDPEKQGDDFTTDTLAELYISQGFFEKAIDIYERMLADHPTSAGLKDKLVYVRAMAAAASGEDGGASPAIGRDSEAQSDDSPNATDGKDVFAARQPGFIEPRLDDWELPTTKTTPVSTGDPASRPVTKPKSFDLGFEPREYVPPDATPRKRQSSEIEEQQAPKGPGPVRTAAQDSGANQTAPGSRKETVERLESWLKNIMKES